MSDLSNTIELPRLKALERYNLTEMPHDPAMDDIARLAAQLCDAPVGVVTLIDRDSVMVLGRFGVELQDAPRYTLPCETTVSGEGVYQIPDARHDPAYAISGIRLGDHIYRFYAGAPVQTPGSVSIGCVSVLDTTPRKLTTAQVESLESLSHLVTTRLELSLRVSEMERAARARARVESALKVERNFVSAVLDTVGALVVVCDTAGRIVRFNRACEIISGYHSQELLGKYVWERLIPEEDVAAYIDSFERIRSGDFPVAYENYWVAADGVRRRISWSATALVDSQAQVAFVIATGIDVTVQRIAETTMRESESRYRQIVEGSLGMVCTHDLDGKILSINEYGAQGVGRPAREVVGRNLAEFIDPDRRSMMGPYLRDLAMTGEAQGLLHFRRSNGEERVFVFRNRLVEPIDGPEYVLAFGVDISEQVRAEEQLRSLIRQSNSVLESVGDGIYGMDLEGRITVINPAAAQMLGYRPEEVLGQKAHELFHHSHADGTSYPAEESPIQATLVNRTTMRVSNEVFWRKDGTSFPAEYVARPQIESQTKHAHGFTAQNVGHTFLRDEARASGSEGGAAEAPGESTPPRSDRELSAQKDASGEHEGRAVGVVVAFTDISERNALDRMKDEFISTVSHELRTPLTSLRAALGLMAGGAFDTRPEKVRQMLDIAIGNTDRLVRLVNDILDLERISSGKTEPHSISCAVDDLFRRATALQQTAAMRANVRFSIEANDVKVWADPDRLLQTLTNLVSNAIKFSPQSAELPSEVRLTARYLTEGEALIEVQDHGRGIPPDKLEQIFERFKQVDASDSRAKGGTGLGLAICRSIVTQHGGHIWATSAPGEGAIFHFTIPTKPRGHLSQGNRISEHGE